VDVGALGYIPWRVREDEIESGASVGQLHFLSDQRLVVTFTSHVIPESLPRRGQPEVSSNLRLNAFFIDSDTGRVQATRSWPTGSERSRILPVGHGRFIVITPDELSLYSWSMEPLKELRLPLGLEAIGTWWDAIASPAGKYLLIWYDVAPQGASCRSALIDTEALRVVLPWGERGNGFNPFDDGNVLTGDGHAYPAIGPPAGPWRSLGSPWGADCKPALLPTPVGDSAIFGGGPVPMRRSCYFLALTTGQLLFKHELADNEYVGSVAASAGGKRFAVETYKVHGGSSLLDIGGRALVYGIKVYDIPMRQWVNVLGGKKQRIKSLSGLALSPDGRLLALIDQTGTLQVYRLLDTHGSGAGADR